MNLAARLPGVRLLGSHYSQLKQLASQRSCGVSDIVRDAISEYLNKKADQSHN